MVMRVRNISLLLIAVMLLQLFPAPAGAQNSTVLFEDSFTGGLGKWDMFGSTAWQTQGSGAEARMIGTTTSTGAPQRAVVKASALPYSTQDYTLSFEARSDRFRTLFRYSSSTNYYFLEFKNARSVEFWKFSNSSTNVQVGSQFDIRTVLPSFDMADSHQYELEVNGAEFKLVIDGTPVTVFNDSDLTAGGVGFSLKSVSGAVNLSVGDVEVRTIATPNTFTINHTPVASVPYNTNLPVSFTLGESTSSVTASVYYGYGEDAPAQVIEAEENGSASFTAVIPGTNRAGLIRYYISAHDEDGSTARYPLSGEAAVVVDEIQPYVNNFEGETTGSAPAGWTTGGNTRVIQLPDGGGKVFNLNGSGSAKLNLPMYLNADNFVVKFKAKYERTSTAVQNTWRFRFRAVDDMNNNAMEWATHNSKYFLMRKTTLGGNYYIANHVKSLLDDWHDYELRISGITHELFIDGVEVASGDDSDPLALQKGYFQWNVVGGINLMIDNFSIDPIPAPYVLDLQPSGNYAGIYTQEESPGLSLALDAGAKAREFRMDYTVRRAEGDKAAVASGTKTYNVAKYAKSADEFPFDPALHDIGTYEVSAEFTVDGVAQPDKAKKMRLVVVKKAAEVQGLDLDNESKFGLNTHYALNWKDDIIDGARKLGARHHRSGITWEEADRNVTDTSGNKVYDYTNVDARLDKLFSYGFNQITVLGIDRNPYYQEGTVNTTAGLKAMGDFVYNTVSRYKGKIRQWEMPNEPEIFTKPYIPAEFVQMQKIAYLNMKKADPDAMLLAGDHTSSVRSVLPKELELGSYDYADAYSYHPYVYNSMPDGNLQSMMDGVKDLVNAYGGWKDYYLTEGGWPTANAGYPSVTEETQRDYVVRAFLNYLITDQVKAYEYYNYKNDGTDDRYYDIFWGITDNDGRPKLAYAAVNNLMTTLDKSRYIGTMDTGNPDVAVHVFLNDGEPVIVAWKKVDHKDNPAVKPLTSEITLPFGAAGLQVKDINGMEIPVTGAGGSVQLTVSGSPVYITGAPAGFVFDSALTLLQGKEQEAAARLTQLRTPENAQLIDADLTELGRIRSSLAAAAGERPAAGLEQGIKDIYALMEQIAGQIGAGSLEPAPGYVALETLYNMAENASVALSYAYEGSGANILDYAAAAQAATDSFNVKKGGYNVMPVTASAVLRMNRYGRLAEDAFARGDYANSYAYNLLAREFAGAAEAISASETPKFIGVMVNVVPTQATGEAGYVNTFNLSLVNDTDAPMQVSIEARLPEGWDAAQTGPTPGEWTLPAHGSLDVPYPVLVPEGTIKGRYDIGFDIMHEGAVFDTKDVQLTVEDGLQVRLVPVKKTIQELDVLTVQLTGTSSAVKSGKVTVKGPDGALLAPVTTDAFSGLKKGDVIGMDFHWTYHTQAAFNEYSVDLQVDEAASSKMIFHDSLMPVEFNLVQQASAVTVDGSLGEWQDAFPFHLRTKAQNASGFHDPANLEATAYAKWAEDGLYFAVAVRDNVHKQSENAVNMWKNDSVQVTLDPLGNREAPYGVDDVEWGFALADDGRLLTNIFNSTPPNPSGEVSGQTPFKAVRDEAAGRTLYEFKIPAAHVKDLNPKLGGSIGFNIAINDADFQNGRDNFIQWTNGTADAKNTSFYDSFAFIDDDSQIPVAGVSLDSTELALKPGEEFPLSVILEPMDAANQAVTWNSDNAAVAAVDAAGKVTAAGPGTAVITVTTADGGFSAACVVTVTPLAIGVTGITLSPSTLSLVPGMTADLTAAIEPADATNQTVTWSSDNTAAATADPAGKVTAVEPGTAVITATTADGSMTAVSTVTVTAEPISVTGITLDPGTLSLTAGGTAALLAAVSPADATNKALTWSSDNAAVAIVDSSGNVTAVGAGTAIITAATQDGGFTAASEVTVSEAAMVSVTGVTLDPDTLSLTVGGTAVLLAAVSPADATIKALTWSSDNAAVAAVDSSGNVTAVGAGTAVITATTQDGGFTAASEVTVTAAAVSVTGVALDRSSLPLTVGGTGVLLAAVSPADAANKALTWSSDNTNVAAVDSSGNVTAVGAGTAVITAVTADGGYTAASTVTVTNAYIYFPPPAAVTPVEPAAPAAGTVIVPPETFTNLSEGTVTVEVPADTTAVQLPANAAELLAQNKLEVKTDNLVLEIPSELIRKLSGQLPAEKLEGSVISLKLELLTPSAVNDILAKGQQDPNMAVKPGGETYEISLTITAADGTTGKLTQLDEPVTISLKVDDSINPRLAGIYFIPDEGRLEYIGGEYADGRLTAQIHHLSKYAVLEVKRDFSDLSAGHWAYNVIEELAAKQIVQGTSGMLFEPGRPITRSEFTAMLVHALKLSKQGEVKFADVTEGDWYREAVSIAYEAGIVTGRSAGTFDPEALITREEMVTMLMKAHKLLPDAEVTPSVPALFADSSEISAWAAQYVQEAAELHLIRGRAEGIFEPKGISTRAEAAQVLYNLISP